MKARMGYIELNPEYGTEPIFKKYLHKDDIESQWMPIVYFELEVE
jgi:hypothetical protein